MIIAIVLILLVLITVLFHFISPWWFTPIASNWGAIDSTINITFWVTGLVFIAVNLFMAYAIYRFRFSPARKADYEPENKKLEGWLTGFTALGVAAMLAPGLFVWAKFVHVPEEAETMEILGKQWFWAYRFPGEDGELGRSDPRFMTPDNPFGLDPDDPAGQDDILVFGSEVYLPVNVPVHTLLRSTDVLHSFAVPQFRVKMDLVPGMVSYLWFEPTQTGTYEILCMQLCGFAHHIMRGKVTIVEEDEFQTWLAQHPTFAETQNRPDPDLDAGRATYAVCASCHGQQGEGSVGLNAPKIAGMEDWYLERQLKYYVDGVRGYHEDDRYGQQMAAMVFGLTSDEAIRNVSAYIGTFPDQPVQPTIEGNLRRGEFYYKNCAACHGDQGEGNWATNAPALAGQHDWYLAQQMRAFKNEWRGSHANDHYGMQMVLMSRLLRDDDAINDLVAYINTFSDNE